MTPQRFHRLRAVLDQRQPDLTVLLENVHKPHNFAAILRTADAVGLYAAHAVCPQGTVRTSVDSASGADKWVRVCIHPTIGEGVDALRDQGFNLLAADPADGAVPFDQVDLTRPTAILLGQEKDGLTQEALAAVDQRIAVPMHGLVTSMNVSVAAAVVLFEARRQRMAAGMYAQSRLDSDRYRQTLFEWAYPRLAAYCRRRRVPYPELDADGDLLEDPRTFNPTNAHRAR